MLSSEDLSLVCSIVRTRTSMQLTPAKGTFIESRLLALVQRSGFPSVSALLQHLRSPGSQAMAESVAEAMTVNETLFFRDQAPFDALRTKLLPRLIARRQQERRLVLWSAACSTGQEALSLAILVREHFPSLQAWRVQILATDVAPSAVARTKAARYSEFEMARGIDPAIRAKYFRAVDSQWEADLSLRNMIDARVMNLAGAWPQIGPIDVVLMRNVLIYFDRDARRGILARTRSALRADGALILGSAETTMGVDDTWHSVVIGRAVIYSPEG